MKARPMCRRQQPATSSEGEDMSPKRILGLAIATSILASSAALAATGTPERVRGTITSATASSVNAGRTLTLAHPLNRHQADGFQRPMIKATAVSRHDLTVTPVAVKYKEKSPKLPTGE